MRKIFLISVVIILIFGISNLGSNYVFALDYSVVEEKDFSYLNCVRKGFKVVIPENTTKEQITQIAKKIYKEQKKRIPELKEFIVHFYYPDLNVHKDVANAYGSWNWGGSGKWEMSYMFLRVKQPEVVDETDKSILKQDEFRKGIFVTYDLIVPLDTSDEGAKRILKKKLNDLKEEWQNKVEWLGVDLFLGENYLPFMKGEWVSARSSRPKKGINIEIDKDGKYQTKKQTKILTSEQMRRQIFYESVQAEDKSVRESERKYPNDFSMQIDHQRKLQAKYKKELAKKYGLTEKHIFRISVEGIRKNWPAP